MICVRALRRTVICEKYINSCRQTVGSGFVEKKKHRPPIKILNVNATDEIVTTTSASIAVYNSVYYLQKIEYKIMLCIKLL